MIPCFYEKVFGALLLLFVPLIIGLLVPCFLYRSHHRSDDSPIIEILNNLASGLLMGTFLLHLLPESTGDLRRELEDTIYSGYPVGELLLGFGFFIVLALEIGIVSYHKKLLIDDISRRPSFDEVDSNDSDFGHSFNSTINGNPILYESNTHQENVPILGPAETNQIEQILSSSKVYVLLFGLSIHSFFEGLVIGFQEERWSLWTLILVVLLHKSLLGLALGISAFRVFLRLRDSFNVLIIFCIASPVGVLSGATLMEMLTIKHDTKIIIGSLNCLASGTFLYVIFMELLPEQLHKRKSSRNIISIVGGFIFISLIQLLTLAEF